MEDIQCGQTGQNAPQHVVVLYKPEIELATIQCQCMVEEIVMVIRKKDEYVHSLSV